MAQTISDGRQGLDVSASMAITRLPPDFGWTASVVGGGAVVAVTVLSVAPVLPPVEPPVLGAVLLSLLLSEPPQAAPTSPALMTNAASNLPDLRRDGAFK